MAYKAVYYRADAPGGGNGTSDALAYNDFATALAACTAAEGDLFVKRGLVYPHGAGSASYEGAGVYVSSKTPAGYLRVRSYGDAVMPPTFHGGLRMLPGDAGWSYIGDGLWVKAISDNSNNSYADPKNHRLFIGTEITGPAVNNSLGTSYVVGKPIARYAIAATSTQAEVLAEIGSRGEVAPRLWMYTTGAAGGNGLLYVYTGTALQAPPTYYGGMTFVAYNGVTADGPTRMGNIFGLMIYNCQRTTIENIDSVYCVVGGRISTNNSANVDNALIGCNIHAYGQSGIGFLGSTSGQIITRAKAVRCVVDASAHVDEEWNNPSGALNWINATQDSMSIGPYSDSCGFYECVSKDGCHINIFIGAQSSSQSGYSSNSEVVDCESHSPNRFYGATCAASGLGTGNTARFIRFYGHDATYFFSRSGSGKVTFESSLFKHTTKPFNSYTANSPSRSNTVPAMAIFPATSWGALETGCVTLNSCTVMQPYGFILDINRFTVSGTVPSGVFNINNSLLVDTENLNNPLSRTWNEGIYDVPGVTVVGNVTLPADSVVVSNSYLWTGAVGQNRVATSYAAQYTLAAAPFISGTFSEADPMVDANGFVLAGSPLIGAGGHPGYSRDKTGAMFKNPRAIGCYEYNDGSTTGP